jgi:plastocyanin
MTAGPGRGCDGQAAITRIPKFPQSPGEPVHRNRHQLQGNRMAPRIEEDLMKNRQRKLAPALALAAGAVLALSAQAAVFNVQVANFAFTPPVVTIATGDTVHWFWASGFHTTTSGTPCSADSMWDAHIDQTHPTFDFTFNTTGTFDYFCRFHCLSGMTGSVIVQGPSAVDPEGPSGAGLSLTASPNPFHSPTAIRFELPLAGPAKLAIFDASGRQVAALADGEFAAGARSFRWDGRSDSGEALPGGIYFARAWSAGGAATATIVKLP